MAKPRSCPHCRVRIPFSEGYHFDEKMNMICGACGKIAYLSDSESGPQYSHHAIVVSGQYIAIEPETDV